MGTYITVDKTNPKTKARFDTVAKGFNQRWPSNGQEPESILVCRTEEEIIKALGYALGQVKPLDGDTGRTGKRITVRSGGHCYEGFVSNNPGGVIIDVSQYGGLRANVDEKGDYPASAADRGFALVASDYAGYAQNVVQGEQANRALQQKDLSSYEFRYKILPGTLNWDGYVALYKQYGKTIPGGSCYNVGAGGHISGGGYGLLSRKHGLTTDWLSAVDVVIAPDGKTPVKVFASPTINPELFRLCCGAGGGNVGIITAYYFHDLPDAPQEATFVSYTIPWRQFYIDFAGEDKDALLKPYREKFAAFLQSYAEFFAKDRGAETAAYEGLFTLMHANHVSKENLTIAIQYVPAGDVVADTDKVIGEFTRVVFEGIEYDVSKGPFPVGHSTVVALETHLAGMAPAVEGARVFDWLALTEAINDSGMNRRGKYKSAYLKTVSTTFAEGLYDALTRPARDKNGNELDVSDSVVQIDSYGGRINRTPYSPAPSRTDGDDAVYQRQSVLKIQYQVYWFDPAEDDDHIQWLRGVYNDCFPAASGHRPWGQEYEGCYINYPDTDMLLPEKDEDPTKAAALASATPHWTTLYYGDKKLAAHGGKTLPEVLGEAKLRYDPHDVFRHEMSIPPKVPISRAQG